MKNKSYSRALLHLETMVTLIEYNYIVYEMERALISRFHFVKQDEVMMKKDAFEKIKVYKKMYAKTK